MFDDLRAVMSFLGVAAREGGISSEAADVGPSSWNLSAILLTLTTNVKAFYQEIELVVCQQVMW